jgi:CBS domain
MGVAMSDVGNQTTVSANHEDRAVIARWVLAGSFTLICIVTFGAVVFTVLAYFVPGESNVAPGNIADILTDLLNVLLPVVGAWIGALIAFYFARDNYIAATESAKILLGDRKAELEKIAVGDVMIKLPQMEVVKTPDDDPKLVKDDILQRFVAKGLSRLPILTSDNLPKGVLHDSVVQQYLIDANVGDQPATLSAMLNDQKIAKRLSESTVIVPATATLREVKEAMDRRSKETSSSCRDVFVTQTGTEKGAVIGYVSDMDLAKRGAFG